MAKAANERVNKFHVITNWDAHTSAHQSTVKSHWTVCKAGAYIFTCTHIHACKEKYYLYTISNIFTTHATRHTHTNTRCVLKMPLLKLQPLNFKWWQFVWLALCFFALPTSEHRTMLSTSCCFVAFSNAFMLKIRKFVIENFKNKSVWFI